MDERGYLPIDTEGARLLFQAISDAYEKQSLMLTTNLEFSKAHLFVRTCSSWRRMAAGSPEVCRCRRGRRGSAKRPAR
ncbi:ATP-binding protein [Arthrobacter rhombi]|uniref:ATP-binding protein n=1 Tax=Arthrobacter rhombi TaxID=71253 RepID=UPI003FD5F8FD